MYNVKVARRVGGPEIHGELQLSMNRSRVLTLEHGVMLREKDAHELEHVLEHTHVHT